MKRIIYLGLIFGISLILYSCSQPPIPVAQVHVAQEAPVEQELMPESLDIKNCLSSDDMVTTLAAQAPVRQKISISKQATIVATGSAIDIPDEIYDELKSQVESARYCLPVGSEQSLRTDDSHPDPAKSGDMTDFRAVCDETALEIPRILNEFETEKAFHKHPQNDFRSWTAT